MANVYLDSALQAAERLIRGSDPPLSLVFEVELAAILAWLGRKEAAINHARELVRRDPISQNATNGPGWVNTAAEIFALFGQDVEALEQLEAVLSVPSYNSVAMVRVNPVWQRFRGNPRFEALLAKYDTPSR